MTCTDSTEVQVLLLAATFISLLISLYIIFWYLLKAAVRRHPNNFIARKAVADFVWCVCVMWPGIYEITHDPPTGNADWECLGYCEVYRDSSGRWLSLATQIFDVYGNLQFAVLAFDLYANSKSPFADFGKNVFLLDILTMLTSLFTGIYLVENDGHGQTVSGYCQTRSPSFGVRKSEYNWNFLLFLLPHSVSVLMQLWAMIVAKQRYKQREGYQNRIWRKRNVSLRLTYRYTVFFCLYWVIMICLDITFLVYVNTTSDSRNEGFEKTFALMKGLRAVSVGFIWLLNYPPYRLCVNPRKHKQKSEDEKSLSGEMYELEELAPQLNAALREELVEYLKRGILCSLRTPLSSADNKGRVAVFLTPRVLEEDNVSLLAGHTYKSAFEIANAKLKGRNVEKQKQRTRKVSTVVKSISSLMSLEEHNLKTDDDSILPVTSGTTKKKLNSMTLALGGKKDPKIMALLNKAALEKESKGGISSLASGTMEKLIEPRLIKNNEISPETKCKTVEMSQLNIQIPVKTKSDGASSPRIRNKLSLADAGKKIVRSRRISYIFKAQQLNRDSEECNAIFTERMAAEFRSLRKKLGITDEYIQAMKDIDPARETGGRSGSFFFFTKCKRYALKTMSRQEFTVLRSLVRPNVDKQGRIKSNNMRQTNGEPYVDYIMKNEDSLIVKILGCYELRMKDYNHTVFFYVMKNIFRPDSILAEKYDIKGSAGEGAPCCPGPIVNRRSLPPPKGAVAVCKHCNKRYIVGVGEDVSGGLWTETASSESLRRGRILEYRWSARNEKTESTNEDKMDSGILSPQKSVHQKGLEAIQSDMAYWRQATVESSAFDILAMEDVRNHSAYLIPLVSKALLKVRIRRLSQHSDLTLAISFQILSEDGKETVLKASDKEGWRTAIHVVHDNASKFSREKRGNSATRRSSSNKTLERSRTMTLQSMNSARELLQESVDEKSIFFAPDMGEEIVLTGFSKDSEETENAPSSNEIMRVFEMTADISNVRHSACPIMRMHEPVRDLLDNDLLSRMILEPKVQQNLIARILKDTSFLCEHGIMDYSLLLGVEYHRTENVLAPKKQLNSFTSLPSRYMHAKTYHIGIIDLLRTFGGGKVFENFNKRYLLCRGERISASRPRLYKSFFDDFIENEVFIGNAWRNGIMKKWDEERKEAASEEEKYSVLPLVKEEEKKPLLSAII
eukprot:g2797.t1